MGIFPVWGFQLIIAITLAFILRLNKVLVILAANISIPPMIPLILFLSHLTGAFWMGDHAQYITFSQEITFDMMKANLIQYAVGAITLAFVACIISTAITYVMLKIFKRQKV
ncbi:DUF2062 domain-containing protein [Chryseolinea sp. H1M3-3]|uniref:DUF2062 domain-containing protein n=1 Tax=Chryseolinea sp. H1M3-3 TaxID=3034144 RepID=UPI0023ED738F|nr:DUF2062 domain-containing protein [Chryseolinea sp. H1M3-3]